MEPKTCCRDFFSQQDEPDKKLMTKNLSEFVYQSFININNVSPEPLAKTFPSRYAYFSMAASRRSLGSFSTAYLNAVRGMSLLFFITYSNTSF